MTDKIRQPAKKPGDEMEAVAKDVDAVHPSADQETRDEELERLRAAAAEAEKRVLMAQADADNFRKRMRRDYDDQLRFASVPLVVDILQVRDNLLRALEAANSASGEAGLRDGVAMVVKQLDDTLAKYDVREIPAAGQPFDPNFHEAISQMPSDEHQSGMIALVGADRISNARSSRATESGDRQHGKRELVE